METIAATDFLQLLDPVWNVLRVAIGLGLVIFFHEMGHFLAAKWCDVNVERFSIGFGPILLRRKWGETEYALSAIPFGGYVKMLGQDDLDPSQLSSEEIAEDPRSYSSKPVRQRMLIISAGVLVNVITAVLFYAVAFKMGVETTPSVVGSVQTGMPAWEEGLRRGDRITRINGRAVETFMDIRRAVALSGGPIVIEGVHVGGETFKVSLSPDVSGTRPRVGLLPTNSLQLIEDPDGEQAPTAPGTPAAEARPPFQPGDTIRSVDGVDVERFVELQNVIAEQRGETLVFRVQRKGAAETDLVEVNVGPNPFRVLGLSMDPGPVAAVRKNSPAEKAGIQVGDRIVSVQQQVVGTQLDPLRVNDFVLGLLDEQVEAISVTLSRPRKGGGAEELTLSVRPENQPAWLDPPFTPDVPLEVPSLGLALHVKSTVMKVAEGSPAETAGIEPNERILKVTLRLPKGSDPDISGEEQVVIDLEKPEEDAATPLNWAHAFWMIQYLPTRDVTLTVSNRQGRHREVTVKPAADETWFFPSRGVHLRPLTMKLQSDGVASSVVMGLRHTRDNLGDLYLTLRSLFGGRVSVKELHGPIGIFKVAYEASDYGLAQLLLFLGFLSVNLAVLNFLPIPVLDGGHMMFLCWEAVTRRKPSEKVLIAATYCGMAFVLGLMGLVLYLDIFVHAAGN